MKYIKLFMAGIAISACGCGMMSCHNSDDLYDPSFENEKTAQDYAVQFEKKYGKVAPNQTWDFSNRVENDATVLPYIENITRGISSAANITGDYTLDEEITIGMHGPVATVNELNYLRSNLANVEEKDWEPNIYGVSDMWVYYVHGNGSEDIITYSLGIHWFNPTGGSYNAGTEHFTSLPIMGSAYGTNWFAGSGYSAATGMGFRIDPSALQNFEEIYWYAIPDPNAVPFTNGSTDDAEFKAAYELKKFKEVVTPLGAIYWCFDCDQDGDYSDLICLVEPVTVAKRYMVEDLGSIGDFDFNDIVIDVVENGNGQKAVVRAMGGTLDFTIQIGETIWSKKGGKFNTAQMYNTEKGYNAQAVLAEFEVEGWDPAANNIKVTVKKLTGEGVQDIPFPKTGDVPMMFATTVNTKWMEETLSIPSSYFTE